MFSVIKSALIRLMDMYINGRKSKDNCVIGNISSLQSSENIPKINLVSRAKIKY